MLGSAARAGLIVIRTVLNYADAGKVTPRFSRLSGQILRRDDAAFRILAD